MLESQMRQALAGAGDGIAGSRFRWPAQVGGKQDLVKVQVLASLRRNVRPYRKHRAGGGSEDRLCRGSEQKAPQTSAAAGTHHNQINSKLADPAQNRFLKRLMGHQAEMACLNRPSQL